MSKHLVKKEKTSFYLKFGEIAKKRRHEDELSSKTKNAEELAKMKFDKGPEYIFSAPEMLIAK